MVISSGLLGKSLLAEVCFDGGVLISHLCSSPSGRRQLLRGVCNWLAAPAPLWL
jgi:hypothetical protein